MAMPRFTLPIRQEQRNSALLISPFEQDHRILRSIFQEQGWSFFGTLSLESALAGLRRSAASVVITEKHLRAGNWKDVLDAMLCLPDAPLVVVTSLHADNYLWAEALNLGAYDVLAKPFDRTEVIRVCNSAWMHPMRALAGKIEVTR
jgi:DNA-binding NtrC family response regulator